MKKMALSRQNSPSPLYHQFAEILLQRIIDGEYKPGTVIPTEPELCEEFGVSRITIRRAVEILETRGYVKRQQGRGTFVLNMGRSNLTWGFGKVEDLIYLAKNTQLKLTGKRKIKAGKTIAVDLELTEGQKVYQIKGIRQDNANQSLASYLAFVPEMIGREIKIEPIESQLLFLEVEKIAHEPIKKAKQFIYATAADEKLAKEIQIHPGSPVLVTKRIYLGETDRPLLLTFTHYQGDVFQSMSVLERR